MDLELDQGKPPGCRPAKRLVGSQPQVFWVEGAFALRQVEDQGVDRAQVSLCQIDPHRRQLLGQPAAAGGAANLPELGSVTDVGRIDERRHQRLGTAWRAEGGPRKGAAYVFDPSLPAGVVHGGEHRDVSVEPHQQSCGLVVVLDDQAGSALLERLQDGVEVSSELRGGDDL